jgi:hypothetical protein
VEAVIVLAAAVVDIIVGGLLAWAFRPAQTLRRTARTWGRTPRRRTPRIPMLGSPTAAVVIGLGLAALATWIISGAVFTDARAGDVDVVKAALPAMAAAADEGAVCARRQQCIDVLGGYLRMPYDPDSGANHLSEFVSTTT